MSLIHEYMKCNRILDDSSGTTHQTMPIQMGNVYTWRWAAPSCCKMPWCKCQFKRGSIASHNGCKTKPKSGVCEPGHDRIGSQSIFMMFQMALWEPQGKIGWERLLANATPEHNGANTKRALAKLRPNTMKENRDILFCARAIRIGERGGVKRSFFNRTSLLRMLCAWSAVVTAPLLLPSMYT